MDASHVGHDVISVPETVVMLVIRVFSVALFQLGVNMRVGQDVSARDSVFIAASAVSIAVLVRVPNNGDNYTAGLVIGENLFAFR